MSKEYQKEKKKLEDQWEKKLSSILEELTEYPYNRMLSYLNNIDEKTKRKTPRGKMAKIIIDHYGLEKSIDEINNNVNRFCKRDRKIQDLLEPVLKKLEVVRDLSQQQTGNEQRSAGAAGGDNMQRPGRSLRRKRQPSPQPEAPASKKK